MAINYQRPLPHDRGSGEALQEFPAPFVAIQERVSENATTSSAISLSDQTTMLEVTAVGSTGFLKWIGTSNTNPSVISIAGATADFDHVIAPNTTRRFVVPQERAGIPSIAGANIQNGCYQRVAYKTGGIGSILTSEF